MGLATRKSESVMLFEAARHVMQPLCTVTIIECTLGHSIGSSAGIKVELSADLLCVALPLFLCALFLAHRFEVLFGEVPWCAACCQLQSGVQWCSPWCKMVFPFVNLHSPWCTVVFSLVYCGAPCVAEQPAVCARPTTRGLLCFVFATIPFGLLRFGEHFKANFDQLI